MISNNKIYDTLKFIAQIVLPGLAAAYFSLSSIWNLPSANEVVGTITVIDTFLGLFLKRSSDLYNASDEKFDGKITVDETEEKKTFSLELDTHPDDLEKKDEVALKVQTSAPVEVKKTPAKKRTSKPKPDRPSPLKE